MCFCTSVDWSVNNVVVPDVILILATWGQYCVTYRITDVTLFCGCIVGDFLSLFQTNCELRKTWLCSVGTPCRDKRLCAELTLVWVQYSEHFPSDWFFDELIAISPRQWLYFGAETAASWQTSNRIVFSYRDRSEWKQDSAAVITGKSKTIFTWTNGKKMTSSHLCVKNGWCFQMCCTLFLKHQVSFWLWWSWFWKLYCTMNTRMTESQHKHDYG